MNRLFGAALLFVSLDLAACGSCVAPTTEQELKTLDATERQALGEVLQGTGLRAEDLRSIGILGIDRNARAVAVDKGHVVGLRLSGVTVPDLAPAKRLPALETLWLTGCTGLSLGGLRGHAALRDLSLAGSGLTSLAGLADLPRLEELNLDDNKLRSLAELTELPALKKVSARNNQLTETPSVGAKMAINLDGNPISKAAEPAPTTATAASGSVPELPKSKGKTTGRGPHSVKGVLLGNPPLEATGVYESLTGLKSMGIVPVDNADSTVDVELSVETGRVRVYVEPQSRKGYLYAEATPGHPARINGRMIYGISAFEIPIESLDGTATGLRYRVTRASR